MLAARRREEPSNELLDAGINIPTIKSATTDDGVRRAGSPGNIISFFRVLLVQTPGAASRHNSSFLIIIPWPRLRALEFCWRWPSVLGLEPLEERAARGLAGLVAADRVQSSF